MTGIKIILSVFAFVFGAVFGSFSGVLIYRIPNNMSIIKPASRCGSCGHELKWYDNIPIFAYIFLGGKCRYCKAKIGAFYFVIEVINAIAYLLCFLKFGISFDTLFAFLVTQILIVMSGIDYQNHFIYDLNQIILAVVIVLWIGVKVILNPAVPWENLIGAVAGFVVFWLIRIAGKFVFKKEALGFGDVILYGIIGLLLGWKQLIFALLVLSIVGSLIEVFLILIKVKKREDEIAFGPYIALGAFVSMLYGADVLNWFSSLF